VLGRNHGVIIATVAAARHGGIGQEIIRRSQYGLHLGHRSQIAKTGGFRRCSKKAAASKGSGKNRFDKLFIVMPFWIVTLVMP